MLTLGRCIALRRSREAARLALLEARELRAKRRVEAVLRRAVRAATDAADATREPPCDLDAEREAIARALEGVALSGLEDKHFHSSELRLLFVAARALVPLRCTSAEAIGRALERVCGIYWIGGESPGNTMRRILDEYAWREITDYETRIIRTWQRRKLAEYTERAAARVRAGIAAADAWRELAQCVLDEGLVAP